MSAATTPAAAGSAAHTTGQRLSRTIIMFRKHNGLRERSEKREERGGTHLVSCVTTLEVRPLITDRRDDRVLRKRPAP